MNYPSKIITLWAIFLLGMLFHTQLGLMPLFQSPSSNPHTEGFGPRCDRPDEPNPGQCLSTNPFCISNLQETQESSLL
jgi:hypothetical protein